VDFGKCTDKRDRVEGVGDPHHRETVGKSRHQVRSIGPLELNTFVEVIDSLSKPQADDQERGEADHEAKQTDPGRCPLDHGLIKRGRQLGTELGAEGDHAEENEEDEREAQGNSDEARGGGRRCRQPTGYVARERRKVVVGGQSRNCAVDGCVVVGS